MVMEILQKLAKLLILTHKIHDLENVKITLAFLAECYKTTRIIKQNLQPFQLARGMPLVSGLWRLRQRQKNICEFEASPVFLVSAK